MPTFVDDYLVVGHGIGGAIVGLHVRSEVVGGGQSGFALYNFPASVFFMALAASLIAARPLVKALDWLLNDISFW